MTVKSISGLAVASIKNLSGLAIASAKSYSGVSFTDADATTFINACAAAGHALTANEQTYINTLVVALKGHSLWTKFYAIYPMIGGDVATVVINLKNPGTYDLNLVGSPTVSDNGIDWNGTSQYADTGIVPSSVLSQNDSHISYYSREDVLSNRTDMGCGDASYNKRIQICGYNSTDNKAWGYINTNTVISETVSDSLGLYMISRTGATATELYKNGVSLKSSAAASSGLASNSIFIGAINNGSAGFHTTRQCAFATVGIGFNDTEASDIYTDIQAFQTSLGRNV